MASSSSSSSSSFTPAFPYRRYECDLENVHTSLDSHGVAVIPNVISSEEVLATRQRLWDSLSRVLKGRFDVNKKKTWKSFDELTPLHSMLLQNYGLGHLQPIWDLRQHPAVANVFSSIWKTSPEDLLVSFDGLAIHLPPETTKKAWYDRSTGNWLHTDQSPRKVGKQCIQGMICLYDVRPGDATLSVLEGSQKHHASFFSSIGVNSPSDWYKLKGNDSDSSAYHEQDYFLERGCERTCVQADAGSLILWDSRTMHQGMEPQHGREEPNFRMNVYICMVPRRRADPENIAKKQEAFRQLRMTSHWPDTIKLFPETPRGHSAPDLEAIRPPQLTPLGRRLAGF